MAEVIRCQGLRKSFDGVLALDDLRLELPTSGIVGLIGPNGAGKTTLVNAITGFLTPDGGHLYWGKRDITRCAAHEIARLGVARTFQDVRLIRLISARENVMLHRRDQRGEKLWRALTSVGTRLEEERSRAEADRLLAFSGLGEHAEAPAGTLSYGQQKLLTLICCLAAEPTALLLDEPVSGVHPEMVQKILRILCELRESGKLVLFIEHDIAAVRQIADWVVVMDHGAVIAKGRSNEVLNRAEIVEAFVG